MEREIQIKYKYITVYIYIYIWIQSFGSLRSPLAMSHHYLLTYWLTITHRILNVIMNTSYAQHKNICYIRHHIIFILHMEDILLEGNDCIIIVVQRPPPPHIQLQWAATNQGARYIAPHIQIYIYNYIYTNTYIHKYMWIYI